MRPEHLPFRGLECPTPPDLPGFPSLRELARGRSWGEGGREGGIRPQWWRGVKGKRRDPRRWLARRRRKSDRQSLCLQRFSWAHPRFRDNQGAAYSHWRQLLLSAYYPAPQSWDLHPQASPLSPQRSRQERVGVSGLGWLGRGGLGPICVKYPKVVAWLQETAAHRTGGLETPGQKGRSISALLASDSAGHR